MSTKKVDFVILRGNPFARTEAMLWKNGALIERLLPPDGKNPDGKSTGIVLSAADMDMLARAWLRRRIGVPGQD